MSTKSKAIYEDRLLEILRGLLILDVIVGFVIVGGFLCVGSERRPMHERGRVPGRSLAV